jgi:hypothetical protein
MSREEIINDVKRMNEEIINLGDELYWLDWITLGVPDEATEEDLEDVAPGGNIDAIEIVYDERK